MLEKKEGGVMTKKISWAVSVILAILFFVLMSWPTASYATLDRINWTIPTAGEGVLVYKSGTFERLPEGSWFDGPRLADSLNEESFQAIFRTMTGEELYFNTVKEAELQALNNSSCFLVTRRNSLVEKVLGWFGNTFEGVSKYTPLPPEFCE